MSQKTISIIIPAYQHAQTIEACLDSIFSQTILPDEIIVVNDGSTDGLKEKLKPWQEKIKLINQNNQGSNQARNNGFAQSNGDYIIFVDADLIMQPDMLEKMKETLDQHPEVSYVYSSFRFGWKKFSSFPFSEQRLQSMNFIHTSSLIKREAFPKFDEKIKRFQDWDVWLTMLEKGYIGIFIEEELFSIQEIKQRKGISQWRPAFIYNIPWLKIGWIPQSVKEYYQAREIIRKKHHL